MFRLILFAVVFILTFLSPVPAQENSGSTPAPTTIGDAKSFHPTEATNALLKTVPAEERAKSDAYFEGGYWLLLWNFLIAAAISIFLLTSRLSARLRNFAERMTESKTPQ